jgi:hypothetical protein
MYDYGTTLKQNPTTRKNMSDLLTITKELITIITLTSILGYLLGLILKPIFTLCSEPNEGEK